ncbi:GDSL-type esterase/lipase family protein [Peribacillus deserti]|uniref:SGNH hydrolase-type esterase domain-containing protein n=1 Tax=Peribacillus deserti TaxID=673318 RepID=A0A2N5M357_9BACI|nr:GDSL-type esterase/lipase family protein [Peribacillus deserti]PLT28798.1 hypothetical protein CUU66_16410 [Peribacillus deserti]
MEKQSAAGGWAGSWSVSPVDFSSSPLSLNNKTIRAAIRLSIGGNQIRLGFSNRYGTKSVVLTEVNVVKKDRIGGPVLFQGNTSVVMHPHQENLLSDPLELDTNDLEEIKVSMFFEKDETVESAYQGSSRVTSIAGINNDFQIQLEDEHPEEALPLLSHVEVYTTEKSLSVVTFGDSITAMDWPDCFVERLAQESIKIGILRQGIGGNKVLNDSPDTLKYGMAGIKRFRQDALSLAGVKYIVVLHGVNDIIHSAGSQPISKPVEAEQIISGLKQYICWTHEENLKIFGATLLPFGGYEGVTSVEENKRQAINDWIRYSGEFDAVIDFDRVLRNPEKPLELLPVYDSGDHLHPSSEGAMAMARSIDLGLFV